MNTIRVVGIDIAKSVFQVCVWMNDGSVAWNRKISRQKLLDTLRRFEPGTLIAMEACSTSHYWGRTLSAMGFSVRVIPAQHVKAFVRSQKNDANDALAICETACRPGIHFVPVKTTEQQDIKALRNTRQFMVEQRTGLANQIRSLLAEYDFTIPVGIQCLQQQLPELIEEASNGLTFTLRRLLSSLQEDMQALNERIASLDSEIAGLSSQQIAYRHLLTIPGVGPLIAAAFLSEVDAVVLQWAGVIGVVWPGSSPAQFGRKTAAIFRDEKWKPKSENSHYPWCPGSNAMCKKRDDNLGRWLQKLEARRGFLKTTVALANKLTRIIWRVLFDLVDFNMNKAFSMN